MYISVSDTEYETLHDVGIYAFIHELKILYCARNCFAGLLPPGGGRDTGGHSRRPMPGSACLRRVPQGLGLRA